MIKIKKLSDITKKKYTQIICFGAGKKLEEFATQFPDITIDALTDNYKYNETDEIVLLNRRLPIYPPYELPRIVSAIPDTAIIITSRAYDEIVDQLDRMDHVDSADCYLFCAENESIYVSRTNDSLDMQNYALKNKSAKQKKYQIWEYVSPVAIAGWKARIDIKDIAGEMGYQVLKVHMTAGEEGTGRRECSERLNRDEWEYCYHNIEENSILLIQMPTTSAEITSEEFLKRLVDEKHVHIICLYHDIEKLRIINNSKARQKEFEMTKKLSEFFIVHNEKMMDALVDLGIPKDRMYNLKIFDYLCKENEHSKKFSPLIYIAGNLSPKKSPYINKIKNIHGVSFRLYGPDFPKDAIGDNITYCGVMDSENIPGVFEEGFGLVWDGTDVSSCSGETGEYLKYNNPHKLSLYLAAGMPVIIWKEAAEAGFVIENNVGIAVSSLYELEKIIMGLSAEEYDSMANNAKIISGRLRSGQYTQRVLQDIEKNLR